MSDVQETPSGSGTTTSDNATDNKNKNGSEQQSRAQSNQQRSDRNRRVQNFSSENDDFSGITSDFDRILALRSEKLKNKINLERFKDTFATYIDIEVTRGAVLSQVLRKETDPVEKFKKEKKPELKENASDQEIRDYHRKMDKFDEKVEELEEGKMKIYSMI